jgi:hypothetical protein
MGANILVIRVNIMFFLETINIRHLGRRDFIIFITVKSWCDKVRIIRIILKIVLVHSRTKWRCQIPDVPSIQLGIGFHPE